MSKWWSMGWTLVEVWEYKNEHIWKITEHHEKHYLKDLRSPEPPVSDCFIYETFTCWSPQTSSPLSSLHFLLPLFPGYLFTCSSVSSRRLLLSSSSSSSPPAGLCEQSLFSFLFSSFSSSWNSVLIYVHINYFSFVISSVGHDTILWAHVHPPPHPVVNLNEKIHLNGL